MFQQNRGIVETLKPWERATIAGLALAAVVFGVLVTVRTALLSRRMGDLGVYTRAGWAARQGGSELYSLRCDNGWSYNYPPLLAILFIPFADAPYGKEGSGPISFELVTILWYLLNLFFLFWGIHLLASAHESIRASKESPQPHVGSPSWWRFRLIPLFACLLPIGSTLMKGQSNLLVLFSLCGFLAYLVRGRSFLSGIFLATAICIKIFPAFLLILPLHHRNLRCLLGCTLGLLVGLVAIPVLVFGPHQAVACYREFAIVTLAPGLGLSSNSSRATELTNATATDNHNLRSLLHNTLNLDRPLRPSIVSPLVGKLHWLLGGLLTLLTLIAFRRHTFDPSEAILLYGGSLIVVMLLICPVTHLHYFCFLLPLIMTITYQLCGPLVVWCPVMIGVMALSIGTVLIEQLPGSEVLRDLCVASYGGLIFWGMACFARPERNHRKNFARRFARLSIAN